MLKNQQPEPKNETENTLEAMINKNPCPKCRPKRLPFCACGGGGGGGNSEDTGADEDKDEKSKNATVISGGVPEIKKLRKSTNQRNETKSVEQLFAENPLLSLLELDDLDLRFLLQSQSLRDLLEDYEMGCEAGLLVIKSEGLRGDITFAINPELVTNGSKLLDAKNYLTLLKNNFDEFKEQEEEQSFYHKDMIKGSRADLSADGTKLAIHFSTPDYFLKFMKFLKNKNLTLQSNPEWQRKENKGSDELGIKPNYMSPTPLKTKPTPGGKKVAEK